MAPWRNGRIERFFGTFKRKIRAWIAEGGNVEKLYQELDVFRCWYNHIRPHQNLDGLTPGEAREGHQEPKSRGQPRFSRSGMASSPASSDCPAAGDDSGARRASKGEACPSAAKVRFVAYPPEEMSEKLMLDYLRGS